MAKIRVLVVDDAVVIRRLVSDVLNSDPAIEVVGAAANGRIALAKIPQVNPDLITLDIEMPEMDGAQTLIALRKSYPKLPVIMFSTLTSRGAVATLEALALGANDYVTKPANVGNVGTAIERVKEDLVPKIKAFCRDKLGPSAEAVWSPRTRSGVPAVRARTTSAARVEAVVIGVSTGGPNALATVIPSLPGDFPVPVLIAQHMPPVFTRSLADRLATRSKIEVREAVHGELLATNHAYVAPGDYHLTVQRRRLETRAVVDQGPPENSCRPAADTLFRSAAKTYGAGTLAVVMTGMGKDGLRGCEAVREAGGQVIVQDEATSVVWGMPGFVAEAGLAEAILPLDQIAREIARRVCHRRADTPLTAGR